MADEATAARSRAGGRRAVGLLSLALLSLAAALILGPVAALAAPSGGLRVPWALLVVLFALGELIAVHLQFRREVHTVALAEVPLIIGLFTTDPVQVVLARLIGSGLVVLLRWRQTGVKLLFNLALFALDGCVASLAFHAVVAGRVPAGGTGMGAAFLATLASHLLGLVAVTAAISLDEGAFRWGPVRRMAVDSTFATSANTSLALVTVTVLASDRQVAWLLLMVAAVLFLAYRAYESLRTQHQALEALHHFTRNVGRPEQVGSVVAAVLTQTRELLKAERAELLPIEPAGAAPATAIHARLGPGERVETPAAAEPHPLTGVLAAELTDGDPLFLRRRDADQAGRQALEAAGAEEVLAAALTQTSGGSHALVVSDRRGELGGFSTGDLELLRTLASHAGVALERDRLFISLRREAAEREHQALHDALTGLPNRRAFGEAVERALEARQDGAGVGVLLLDLDRFKDVNDTFGHHHGDLLLRQVGERLVRSVPPGVVIARLGGDEFALLAPALREGVAEAMRLARHVGEVLREPLGVQGVQLEAAASIGVAVGPEHGGEASVLLQRADVALYVAKEAHTGVERYAPELDRSSPRHLMLVGPLRSAIERRELTVVYQPKVLVRDGRVIGVEALVRWNHPEHGFVPPDEFVQVAESTGLIRPLGLFVIETAVRQAMAWRGAGRQFGVAVNLSVRNLLDPDLLPFVAELLHETAIPPALVTFELTEGHVMADPEHAIEILAQLGQTGVHLSVDDYGTGYSSLAYLKRLPIDEVKIDRSFVMNMAADAADAAIVESTVELAHSLNLSVVAEGVEDQATWDRLAALGCDLAQGYFLGRPMPPDELLARFPPAGPTHRDIPLQVPAPLPARQDAV